MIITYHDGACIKVSAGDTSIVFGPVSKESKKFKPTNFGTDVAFVSVNNPDMNGIEESSRGDKKAFAITGPGEYEVAGITAAGFASRSEYGGEERINTIYSVHMDGLSVLYVGALIGEVPSEVLEMDSPDVLIVPISGEGTLSASEAQKLGVKLECKIIIPVLASEASSKQLVKEAGTENVTPVDKLTIKPKDVVGKQNEVVILV
jgi:L-ascorbate metabolism protein UlaG (beta-lactamase superfamily)